MLEADFATPTVFPDVYYVPMFNYDDIYVECFDDTSVASVTYSIDDSTAVYLLFQCY